MEVRRYEQPVVTDYGSLIDLTEAIVVGGLEDGANKNETSNHHSLHMIPGF